MGACGCHGAMLLLLLAPLLSSSMEAGAKTRSSMKYDVSDKSSGPEPQSRVPLDGFESSPRPGRPFISRNDRIPNLLRWLKQQGINHKSINLEDGQVDGLGIYAATDLRTGDEIFQIPPCLIIRPEVPGLNCNSLSSYGALALRLLWEVHRGDASPFAGYLTTLPARHELQLPLLWEQREVQLLAGHEESSLRQWQEAVEEEGRRAMGLAKQLGNGLEGSAGGLSFSMESWVWAWAIAMSRSSCLDRGDESSLAIVPLLDLTNHEDDCLYPIIWADPAGSVRFLASRGYASGEQVTNSYGPLSPANKLFTFGYLDELMGPSGHSQGLPRQGSSFVSFSFLQTEPDEAIRDLRTRALKAAGMCVAEEFEIRVRLSIRRPEQAEQSNGQADAAQAPGSGCEGTVLEPVIQNKEEIDRMLTFLRLSLVDPAWLEGEDQDVAGIVRLFRRSHDKPPPEKELETRVWAQAREQCRRRARSTMRRLEECWRRQARVGLPSPSPLDRRHGASIRHPSKARQRAYARPPRDAQSAPSPHKMRSQRARDPHPQQPHGPPFEARQGRREGAEPRLQEEGRWAHRHVDGHKAGPGHRPREGAAKHLGEDWGSGSQEGLREEGRHARGYARDETKEQGHRAHEQGYGARYDAHSDASVERERLRLTELWLQGERLALQALYTHFGGEGEVAA